VPKGVGEINGYLERTAPWQEAKAGHEAQMASILYTACEALRLVSVLLQPVLPERMGEGLKWGLLQLDAEVVAGPPLFRRDVSRVE
jgi:methionyl-tRNA synthetase